MHHALFGDLSYQVDDCLWLGCCRLPAFAEYGRGSAAGALLEPDEEFPKGLFRLTIQDETGNGPSPQQVNAFQFLLRNESDVCRAVMAELLGLYRRDRSWVDRLERYRPVPGLGRLVGWLVGEECRTPEDLRPFVRCTGLEISSAASGGYAYLGFSFETAWGWEIEHGLSAVFHPEKGARCGDASMIHEIGDAENTDEG
jgi:hypothetical protein